MASDWIETVGAMEVVGLWAVADEVRVSVTAVRIEILSDRTWDLGDERRQFVEKLFQPFGCCLF
jgi:hypothetical protein